MTDWLRALLQRKPRKLADVALANKMARIAWAVMKSGEVYRCPPTATRAAGIAELWPGLDRRREPLRVAYA